MNQYAALHSGLVPDAGNGIPIETSRLIIRNHVQSDLDDYFSLIGNPQSMYYLDDIFAPDRECAKVSLQTAIDEAQSPTRSKFFLAIYTRTDGDYVGDIGFTMTCHANGDTTAHLGYFMKPAFWGKGYMTEAVQALIQFGFEHCFLYKLKTGCIAENVASEAVMKRCGFVKEAHFRAHVLHDGCWKDRLEYGMLRSDWLAQQ